MKQPPEFENIQFIAYCTMILAIVATIFTAGYLTGEMNASFDQKEQRVSTMLSLPQLKAAPKGGLLKGDTPASL